MDGGMTLIFYSAGDMTLILFVIFNLCPERKLNVCSERKKERKKNITYGHSEQAPVICCYDNGGGTLNWPTLREKRILNQNEGLLKRK